MINVLDAHHDTAASCVAYLCSIFGLIDGTISDSENLTRTIDSFYAFHLYANEHWLHHIIAYTQLKQCTETAPQPGLDVILRRLVSLHNEARSTIKRLQPQVLHDSVIEFHGIQDLLHQYNLFQEHIKKKRENTGEGTTRVRNPGRSSFVNR